MLYKQNNPYDSMEIGSNYSILDILEAKNDLK